MQDERVVTRLLSSNRVAAVLQSWKQYTHDHVCSGPTLNPSQSTRPLESYGHFKILEKQNFNKGFEVCDWLGKEKA
jgi:hypothetical protein